MLRYQDVEQILELNGLVKWKDFKVVYAFHTYGKDEIQIEADSLITIGSDGIMRIGDNQCSVPEWFSYEKDDAYDNDGNLIVSSAFLDMFWKFRPALIEICEAFGVYDRNRSYTF